MKGIVSLFVLVLLVGCASSAKQVYLPNGNKGWAISCSSHNSDWSDCAQKAGSLCQNRGYKVLGKDSEQVSSMGGSQQFGIYGSTSMKRTVMIECK